MGKFKKLLGRIGWYLFVWAYPDKESEGGGIVYMKKIEIKSCANCVHGNKGSWWYCNKGHMMVCGNKKDKPKWKPRLDKV